MNRQPIRTPIRGGVIRDLEMLSRCLILLRLTETPLTVHIFKIKPAGNKVALAIRRSEKEIEISGSDQEKEDS